MAKSEYVEDLIETLKGMGLVTSRAMFGAWGLYFEGLIFAIVDKEELFLKVDDVNRPNHSAASCRPFRYHVADKDTPMEMAYWTVPAEVLERPDELVRWCRDAHQASVRAKTSPKKKASRKKT